MLLFFIYFNLKLKIMLIFKVISFMRLWNVLFQKICKYSCLSKFFSLYDDLERFTSKILFFEILLLEFLYLFLSIKTVSHVIYFYITWDFLADFMSKEFPRNCFSDNMVNMTNAMCDLDTWQLIGSWKVRSIY